MGIRRIRLCSHSTSVGLVPTGTRPTGVERERSVGMGRFRSAPSLGDWSCRPGRRGRLHLMSTGSVQVRLDLTAIRDGVACFGSGEQAEYCAVMEVAGSQESLAKIDDAKQEELLAAYAQFLNSITFSFQLVVQVHPIDLTWYVTRVEDRARTLSPALVAIARDHAAYVQGLTRQRTLLERRIYVVVPWSSALEVGTLR